ncbi:unnamed protein product [Sphacelaria rigidula]
MNAPPVPHSCDSPNVSLRFALGDRLRAWSSENPACSAPACMDTRSIVLWLWNARS